MGLTKRPIASFGEIVGPNGGNLAGRSSNSMTAMCLIPKYKQVLQCNVFDIASITF